VGTWPDKDGIQAPRKPPFPIGHRHNVYSPAMGKEDRQSFEMLLEKARTRP
jgi:hypothetical protein